MDIGGWLELLGTPLRESWNQIAAFSPRLIGAAVLLLIGWLTARVARALVRRSLARLDALIASRIGLVQTTEAERMGTKLVAALVFWGVGLLFAGAAAQILGITAITGGLSQITSYFPRLIGAVLVVVAGIALSHVAGSWVHTAARSAKIEYASTLSGATRTMIGIIAGVIALAQVGIDSTFLVVILGTGLAAILGSLALAFGLGARGTVANIVASHYFQKACRINQRIRIGELEGSVLEIRQTTVLLDTEAGVVRLPAKRFDEEATWLLNEAE